MCVLKQVTAQYTFEFMIDEHSSNLRITEKLEHLAHSQCEQGKTCYHERLSLRLILCLYAPFSLPILFMVIAYKTSQFLQSQDSNEGVFARD